MLNVKSILLALSGAVLVLTGCSTVGLGNVPKTREGYNQALNQSDNEQFLMKKLVMLLTVVIFLL